MFQIDFYVAPSTYERENSRYSESLTWDELANRTYLSRFEFFSDDEISSRLVIPDASLFQILFGLQRAKNRVLINESFFATIEDQEGTFDIAIKGVSGYVEICDRFSNQRVRGSSRDFCNAV